MQGRKKLLAGGAVIVAIGLVAGVAIHIVNKPKTPVYTLTVTDTACAPGWSITSIGKRVFTVKNNAEDTVHVSLTDPENNEHFAEYGAILPGASKSKTLEIGVGFHQFHCDFDEKSLTSTVQGVAPPPPLSDEEEEAAESAHK